MGAKWSGSVLWLNTTKLPLILTLLSWRDRAFLLIVMIIGFMLSLLDLFGVLIVGAIGSISISGLTQKEIGNRVSLAINILNLDGLDSGKQIVVLSMIAASSLIMKSILSLYLTKRTLYFLSRRAAVMSYKLVSRYFKVPVNQMNQRSVQLSIYAITDGVAKLMNAISIAVNMVSDMALLLVLGLGLYLVDPKMTLFTAITFGALALFLFLSMQRRMQIIGERQGALTVRSSQKVFEAVSAYREIIVKNRRDFYAREIGELRLELANGFAEANFVNYLSKYILEITFVVTAIALAFFQIWTNPVETAVATIAIFVVASTRITPAILRLQQGMLRIKLNVSEAEPTIRLTGELKSVTETEPITPPLSRNHNGFVPSVVASGLSFSYEGTKRVVKDLDFHANPGEFVAIVGNSGAGKTTLADLILGVVTPRKGNISISGVDPRACFARWPGAVAYVPQDSPVIDGSIRENLGLGFFTSEITDEFCWESLKLVSLESFVRTLPERLDNHVGDRGSKLSGGQRQRLGLARALITQPKLLILDEATSALDGITESEISQSLIGLKGGMTLIVIAHRLTTVVNADRIYYLNDGAIKAVGTFSELKMNYPEFKAQATRMGL